MPASVEISIKQVVCLSVWGGASSLIGSVVPDLVERPTGRFGSSIYILSIFIYFFIEYISRFSVGRDLEVAEDRLTSGCVVAHRPSGDSDDSDGRLGGHRDNRRKIFTRHRKGLIHYHYCCQSRRGDARFASSCSARQRLRSEPHAARRACAEVRRNVLGDGGLEQRRGRGPAQPAVQRHQEGQGAVGGEGPAAGRAGQDGPGPASRVWQGSGGQPARAVSQARLPACSALATDRSSVRGVGRKEGQ